VAATTDRTRSRWLPKGLAGLAGLACAACCLIPVLLAGGVIGGAGWATVGQAPPAVAVMLVAAAALLWWWAARCKAPQCATDCGCSEHAEAV